MDDAQRQRLRALPSIDELLSRPSLATLVASHPRPLVVEALRLAVAEVRQQVLAGEARAFSDIDVRRCLAKLAAPRLRPVLNATGVVLHTNLGRAPLAERAIERLAAIARGYCNLELDLVQGERGDRYEPVIELLRDLTGAQDAMVVNNCAAAVLLTLSALAQGRDALVSRGELVEIGGGFRMPDVMRQSGARLVEVGTTNRTRLADYEQALTSQTGLLVKVHRSNFALVGFTEEATTAELAALGRSRGVLLFEDLGSGALVPLQAEGLTQEPTVAAVVAAGADVVAFSGDKLLGGPQAGLLVGRRETMTKLKAHPLNRALRVDKLTVAALEATLELYRDGLQDLHVPTRAMLLQSLASLEARGQALSEALKARAVPHRFVPCEGRVGGGAMPRAALRSFAAALTGQPAEHLHERLRAGDPAVAARIVDDEVWLDVRCLAEADVSAVASAAAAALEGGAPPC